MKKLVIILISILAAGHAYGQNVADFSLTDVKSNSKTALSDFKSKKGVVVIFTSNVCPFSVYYEGRITQLVSDYSSDIQFILINSHNDEKESEAEMKNKISAWGINIPYLSDKSGTARKTFGARKSPEVFLLKPSGSGFSVFYKGAIDNNPQVASDVKEAYLKLNIENLIAGRGATNPNTRPIGCAIK
ncbi:redoxin domain-containing protein [Fulvivirga lutimaris]|uniref:redoxin domain-containing protein n=1 Tax=Fulvivirga lutimaris TaxID=1819566 RepID=UPI0012BC3B97|nr:redoxin domain-containing protein [Fulvivirga lutimaris]MTI39152.1 redoxin domain-containing protein [Fulvivirga lutimaris]